MGGVMLEEGWVIAEVEGRNDSRRGGVEWY